MKQLLISLILVLPLVAQTPTVINSSDTVSGSRTTINNNFSNMYAERMTYLGAYNSGTTYGKNDVVASGGIWYVSLQAANTANTPASSGTYWVAIPGSGSGGSGGLVRDYPAAVCQASAGSLALATLTATTPVADCVVGANGVTYGVAKFADSGTMAVQGHFKLPASLTSIGMTLEWETTVTNTGLAAVWQLRGKCLATNEANDLTFATAQTVTSNAVGTARNTIFANISSLTTTGCAANERYHWELFRDPTNASDTLASTAELKAITFTVQ